MNVEIWSSGEMSCLQIRLSMLNIQFKAKNESRHRELPLDHHTTPNPLQVTKYVFDYIIPTKLYIKLRNTESITGNMILKINSKENQTLVSLSSVIRCRKCKGKNRK